MSVIPLYHKSPQQSRLKGARFNRFFSLKIFCLATLLFNLFPIRHTIAKNLLPSSYSLNIRFSESSRTVYIQERITIRNISSFDLDTIYLHLSPNAFTSPRSRYYQESENTLNEPLNLNIQEVSVNQNSCPFIFNGLTSLAMIPSSPLKIGDTIRVALTFTITIPEGNHNYCPSYNGTNFRLLNFYAKTERLTTRGWTPLSYQTLKPSCIAPAEHTLQIRLPGNYSVISSLDIMTVTDTLENEKIYHFRTDRIRDLAIAFSPNYTIVPFQHGDIVVKLMLPGVIERRFRLSKNTIIEKVTGHILDYYSTHIIPYPHHQLSVTGSSIPAGVVTSNLIILESKEIEKIANLDYGAIYRYAQAIADQYFHYYIFEAPNASDWLNTGLAAFYANQYMATCYKSLIKKTRKQPQKTSNTTDQILQMAALATDQEKIGRALISPIGNGNNLFLVEQIYHYKSQKVLEMMRYYVGDSTFQSALLDFLKRYQFQPTQSLDFIQILENRSGKNLSLFNQLWINAENIPDQKIKKVRRLYNKSRNQYQTIVITQGDALRVMPVELVAYGDYDTVFTKTKIQPNGCDTLILYSRKPFRKITLDPRHNIWEFNRRNNNYPSNILFNFLIAMPNIDAYQIFYYPTFDFNKRDISRIGLKFRGRYWINMRPLFPSQSLDEWTLGVNYGLRSKTVGYDVSYSTSVLALFFQPRIRIHSRDYFGLHETSLKSEIYIGNINYPLVHRIQGYKKLDIGIRYQNVRTLEFLNKNNWQTGKLLNPFVEMVNFHNWGDFRHITRFYLGAGIRKLDTDYNYRKIIVDTQLKFRPARSLWLYERIFAGFSAKQMPLQDYFYFFGKNTLENMSFESFRLIKGAGDMRGYGAASPKGRNILTSNTEFRWSYAKIEPTVFDLILFFDSGLISSSFYNISSRQLKFDAGMGTEFNALETITVGFHIPFWVSHPVDKKSQFALRWVMSLDLNL